MKIKLCNILHNIKIPIMSYGLIVFTIDKNKEVKYILINKKNTVGFCEIVKGTYDKKNIELSLRNVVKILTKQEVNILLNNTFDDIWKYMWNKNLDNNSKELFNKNKHIIHKLLKEKIENCKKIINNLQDENKKLSKLLSNREKIESLL